jgi:hypothetical protein
LTSGRKRRHEKNVTEIGKLDSSNILYQYLK